MRQEPTSGRNWVIGTVVLAIVVIVANLAIVAGGGSVGDSAPAIGVCIAAIAFVLALYFLKGRHNVR
jgi:hypothetical protein